MTPTNSLSKFDPDAERVRQRMDELRRHHEESVDIHNRTQPIINEKIHDETMKCLKNGQANGTKIKSQKPRLPKRQRNTANATTTTNNNSNSSIATTINNNIITNNQISPQPHMLQQPQHQHQVQSNLNQTTSQQHPQSLYAVHHIQQQHQQQQQQHRFTYQSQPQPQAQPHPHQLQLQQQQLPQQQVYSQQPTLVHHSSPMDPQPYHLAQQTTAYSHHYLNHNHHHHHHTNHMSHTPFSTLPNDLDLSLQAGLECDVDSLIKHEMSVEGQLDFNHDLIQRILF